MASDGGVGRGSEIVPSGGNGIGVGAGIQRTDMFGGGMTRTAETSTAATAEMARAEVEARFKVALARPRDLDDVRVRILKECRRPGFAEVARYSIPRGGKRIEGPSIRLAEVCARHMGNLAIASPVIYEDDEKRIVRCAVTDLESNATFTADLSIAKVVERKNADPSAVLGARKNSFGEMVYLVRATDDEMLQKHNALVSKAIRTLIFRLVPGDIVDEAENIAIETLRARDKTDPDAARKKLVDAFAALGVMPGMLKELIGHDVATTSPAELTELRQVYVAIKEGHSTWPEVMKGKKGSSDEEPEESASKPSTRSGRARAAAAQAAAKARGEDAPPQERPTHDPSTGELSPEDEPPLPDGE